MLPWVYKYNLYKECFDKIEDEWDHRYFMEDDFREQPKQEVNDTQDCDTSVPDDPHHGSTTRKNHDDTPNERKNLNVIYSKSGILMWYALLTKIKTAKIGKNNKFDWFIKDGLRRLTYSHETPKTYLTNLLPNKIKLSLPNFSHQHEREKWEEHLSLHMVTNWIMKLYVCVITHPCYQQTMEYHHEINDLINRLHS